MMYVWGILLSGIVYSAYDGAGLDVFSEQSEPRARMSGLAIGTQFGFALGGLAPTIAAALAGPGLANSVPVAIFCCLCGLVATVTVLTMRETFRLETQQLGNPKSPSVARELKTAGRTSTPPKRSPALRPLRTTRKGRPEPKEQRGGTSSLRRTKGHNRSSGLGIAEKDERTRLAK